MITALKVNGMNCQNCAGRVRNALSGVAGVGSVEILLESGEVQVHWNAQPNESLVLAALKNAGYPATVIAAEKKKPIPAGAGWRLNILVGLCGTVPVMLGHWIWHDRPWFGWLGLLLILPVQVIAGARFYKGAWQQLKIGHSNMDTLVSLGSTAAFGFSVYSLFTGMHHLYFMEAGAILTLISLGHFLEARASEKAAVAVKSLLNLAPETACRLKADGSQETVSVNDLQIGDFVKISPGDRIPTDGVVENGDSVVDESMLTGESLPVEKTHGTRLYAGTVNLDGALSVQVTAIGSATALARIIQRVEHAQTSRAGIERMADRVSSVFVPVVILIAIGTLLGWGLFGADWPAGIIHAVGVLIVACPCAMGLATPAAIMAGTNAAARRGILIRDGVALEKCGNLTDVLFDKTGTLTVGKPMVFRVDVLAGAPGEFESLVLSLASRSKHPFSRALADYFSEASPVELSDWSEVRGSGVRATYQGESVRLGSLKWLDETAPHLSEVEGTLIGLACGHQLRGIAVLFDAPKPHAKEMVSQITRLGYRVHLVSGDAAATVRSLGSRVGILPENSHAEIAPGAKAGIVEAIQRAGRRVAFVGDGINDAPALAQADLGVAVMQASDVATEAADLLLLNSDIEAIPEALELCAATLRTIRQNLFWAFFYNSTAIPLAAAGWMSPVFCAVSMALSDLFVIGNALRLLRWKRR